MSAVRNFQDFQFSDVSDSRKKVDVQSLDPQHLQNHADGVGHRETDASRSESEFNLRQSLAWDSAFFTSPGVLDPEELETLSIRVVDNGVDTAGGGDLRSVPSRSAGPEGKSAIDECSLRKSLTWDSAFFTSSGVLSAEELSFVNGGFRLSQGHTRPGIKEVWRSAESNSTRNADAYSLASLEIDLFDNVRVSMRKSNDASSTKETSSRKVRREHEMQRGNTSKTSDASSRLRAKQGPNKESKSFIKSPNIFCQSRNLSAAPNKRASSGANNVKMENKGAQAASGRTKIVSKKTCIRDSCSIIRSSTPPVKSSSSAAPFGKELGGSGCVPNFTVKSSPDSLRRTINSQVSASASISRTPRQHSAGNIKELVNSSNSTSLLSTPKSSSCTSPASSTDGCSSESSSIILNTRSAAIHATTACRGISFSKDAFQISDSKRRQCNEYLIHESHKTKFMNAQLNKIPEGTSLIASIVSKGLQSSSLRMPSPKIGYFDAGNSMDITPNGGLKFSGVQSTSSKYRGGISNANGAADRTRNRMHQLVGATPISVNRAGAKEPGCLQEKKQPLKELEVVKAHVPENKVHRFNEDNKENIGSFENQVDDLSRRMEGIAF
ncbi:PREDICTED: dentin sialophosphoprotein [Populus euphratica]|uniref:Dentin sialophosphoprotein n=1 Tax=Populus euphratica TaxID=75702 RepID=A0AAJ6U636_POPEU|nr:PREDICTED: dentin sialophosphoprotein [Populus euphratica]